MVLARGYKMVRHRLALVFFAWQTIHMKCQDFSLKNIKKN